MLSKNELVDELKGALKSGLIERSELESLISTAPSTSSSKELKKFSVVQGLFYVTGIVLFAAVLSVLAQTWSGGTGLHIILTLVLGSVLWLVAYLIGSQQVSEVRLGLADSLLLTGSLLVVTGGYVVINIFGGYDAVDFLQAAPVALVLAAVHVGLWMIVRRDLPYLLGVFLAVVAVGALTFEFLRELSVGGDVVALALVLLLALLSWSTHTVASLSRKTAHLAGAFDNLAIVASLITVYIASFGDLAWLWYLALAGGIIGVYYRSIVVRQRLLLGTASIFLVLLTITLSFRYFGEFGVTASLILSAMAILGVAMLASNLSKKYLT